MSKRIGFDPFILLTEPGDGTTTGGASAGGGYVPITSPMSYTDWLGSDWAEDMDGSGGEPNDWDYAFWWEAWGYDRETWQNLNPDLDWTKYFGPDED